MKRITATKAASRLKEIGQEYSNMLDEMGEVEGVLDSLIAKLEQSIKTEKELLKAWTSQT